MIVDKTHQVIDDDLIITEVTTMCLPHTRDECPTYKFKLVLLSKKYFSLYSYSY